MIKPHGSNELKPLFVHDAEKHDALMHEAAGLKSIVISCAAVGNDLQLGGGYYTPMSGYMKKVDALATAEKMVMTDSTPDSVPEGANVLMDYYQALDAGK
ncbi:MAG: hypothetical protein H6981_12235 [Gammaproteobacteria bacterium]|nr:hypothetical protein [Gammaproteobacteria bacterium]MCP5137558.1 hypothetical protein [Gammaproteobacteria bacterium]